MIMNLSSYQRIIETKEQCRYTSSEKSSVIATYLSSILYDNSDALIVENGTTLPVFEKSHLRKWYNVLNVDLKLSFACNPFALELRNYEDPYCFPNLYDIPRDDLLEVPFQEAEPLIAHCKSDEQIFNGPHYNCERCKCILYDENYVLYIEQTTTKGGGIGYVTDADDLRTVIAVKHITSAICKICMHSSRHRVPLFKKALHLFVVKFPVTEAEVAKSVLSKIKYDIYLESLNKFSKIDRTVYIGKKYIATTDVEYNLFSGDNLNKDIVEIVYTIEGPNQPVHPQIRPRPRIRKI